LSGQPSLAARSGQERKPLFLSDNLTQIDQSSSQQLSLHIECPVMVQIIVQHMILSEIVCFKHEVAIGILRLTTLPYAVVQT
jgi:hypothetical protein